MGTNVKIEITCDECQKTKLWQLDRIPAYYERPLGWSFRYGRNLCQPCFEQYEEKNRFKPGDKVYELDPDTLKPIGEQR